MARASKILLVTVPGTDFRIRQFIRSSYVASILKQARRWFSKSDQKQESNWFDQKSNFNSRIKKDLASKRLRVVVEPPFEWTRHNGQKRREEAADDLRRKLKALKRQHPDFMIFCVGHSHGGSVLWLAMKDPECESVVSGAICLATPFLVFGSSHSNIPFQVAIPVFSAGCAALVCLTFGVWRSESGVFWIVFPLGLVCVILAGAAAELSVAYFRSKVTASLSSSVGSGSHKKFLIIHSLGDGVRGFLSAVSTFISSPRPLLFRSQKFFIRLQSIHLRNENPVQSSSEGIRDSLLALGIGYLTSHIDAARRTIPHPFVTMSFISFIVISGFLWSWVLGVWCFFSGVLGALMRAIAACIVFGRDLFWKSLLSDIAVETTPEGGPWEVIQLNPFVLVDDEGLAQEFVPAHSVHAHPDVPPIISQWILSRL